MTTQSFYSAYLKFKDGMTFKEREAVRKQLKAQGFDHQKPFYFTDGNKEQEARAKKACEAHCAPFQSKDGTYTLHINVGFNL